MKVIQILPELNSGGVERGTLEMGKFLVDQGHESIVISNGGRLVGQLKVEGNRHIELPVHKKRLSSLKQVKELRKLFEAEKPDVLHLRSRLPAWLAYLAWRKINPRTRPSLISTVHGFNSVNFYSKIMTCGERVICTSNSVQEYIKKNYPGINSSKLTVIHRGIERKQYPTGFEPDQTWFDEWYKQFPETRNKRLLCLPGRITRLKGHEDFLHILTFLKDTNYHGIIVGGADVKKQRYLKELETLVEKLGLKDKITFCGYRSDLKEILSISEIVLSLTQQPEAFGRTTLEALALGTPVLGYNHGGVGEILQAIFSEGMIRFGDQDAVIQRIQEWDLGVTPLPKNEIPFTLENMLKKTLSEYTKLIESSN